MISPAQPPQPPNCSTCSYAVQENEESRFKFCPIVDHYVQMYYNGNWIPYTQTAQDIIKCGCASHSSRPSSTPETPKKAFGCNLDTIKPSPDCFGEWQGLDSEKCKACHIWGYCADLESRTAAIRKDERERVLGEIGAMINSRIAKMEILNSKNPSSLRKGILLAYRDIEEWERQQRKSSQSTTEAQK